MKKFVFVLLILLFITGCGNKEEVPKGDILDFDAEEALSNYFEYDMFRYHLNIRSLYEGKPYNNTIFSFVLDNNMGMYLFNYHQITKKDINRDLYQNKVVSNNKLFKYYIIGDTVNIIYDIDSDYYLQLSIKSLNNDINNIEELFGFFDFDINII